MLRRSAHAAFALTALAAAAFAQTPVNLIGGAWNGANGLIQRENICNPARGVCTPILGAPVNRDAGGTAYDPIRQVVWDTDGPTLVAVSYTPSTTGACVIMCPPQPVPGVPAPAYATGLAFEEDGTNVGALWSVDSGFGLQRMVWATSPRCPSAGQRCSIAPFMPTPAHRPGGLAISERHRMIFYSASDFTAAVPNNWVFGALLSNPCQPTCRLQIPTGCVGVPLQAITGLAFDDCRSVLSITDGRIVMQGVFTPPSPVAGCQLSAISCCTAPLLGAYYGLCQEPSHAANIGSSCLAAPCVICPSMALNEVGDASMLNTAYGFQLTGAPAGALAFCFGDIGPCTPGIPFLCGLIHLPVIAPFMISAAAAAGAGCAATAFHGLAIPMNPSLCGATISVQDIIICAGGGGFGLSNAVCVTLSDT